MLNAYEHISTAFIQYFARLQSLEVRTPRTVHSFERFMLLRMLGQQCYLAEEMLEPEALAWLKWGLSLDEAKWSRLKQKGIWGLDIVVMENAQRSEREEDPPLL